MINNNPIGVLDSGLGGLTVWKEIISLLPEESTIYLGDSLNAPYGAKTESEIYVLSKKQIEFLLTQKVKLIVIACNTITVSCLDKLRKDYPGVPIVGTVPVIKTAAQITKNRRFGILSTTRTAASTYQQNLINEFAGDCKVFVHGTDKLVPFIEKGEMTSDAMTNALQEVVTLFQKEEIDTLVLGSTHFPFLREQLQKMFGTGITILDSGPAIARQVNRILENNDTLATKQDAQYLFYTTGDPVIANKLLDVIITVEKGFESIKLSS